jgi:hippurate hydrolase
MIKRIEELASSIATGFGGSVEFDWHPGYPVTMNNSKALKIASKAAENAFGPDSFEFAKNPWMGSEDFSFMLEKVPAHFYSLETATLPRRIIQVMISTIR